MDNTSKKALAIGIFTSIAVGIVLFMGLTDSTTGIVIACGIASACASIGLESRL